MHVLSAVEAIMNRPALSLLVLALAVLVLSSVSRRADAFSVLSNSASCATGDQVLVSWVFYNDPASPIVLPAWVGYDVLRRSASSCGAFTRINDAPIPRGSGTNQTGEFLDTTPAPGATYQYRLVPVAANHDPISLPSTELSLDAWRGCPETTTTVLRGSVAEDWGWTVALAPCAESCYPRAYIEGPPSLVAELRAFLGTGQAFDFFGGVGCGGVEGCGLTVDSYAPAACGSTPSRTTTWGELKASYR
jgi:hypothetical protein